MEKKKASKAGAQKSPVSKVWLCKFHLSILSGMELEFEGYVGDTLSQQWIW